MQEYKRRQFRGHLLSLAGKSLRTERFRGVLASRAQLRLGDQPRFENNIPTTPFETSTLCFVSCVAELAFCQSRRLGLNDDPEHAVGFVLCHAERKASTASSMGFADASGGTDNT